MTKLIKYEGSVIKSRDFYPSKKHKYFLNLIKSYGSDAYYRKGNFSSELIWDGKSYNFPTHGKYRSFQKGIFLFAMVRKDAKTFLEAGGRVKIPKKYPVNEYNDAFDKLEAEITGTDLNHAYWRIAYNLGIIKPTTYKKGLGDDFKTVRLAALSMLGKGKDYYLIRDGKITKEVVKIGKDDELEKVYKAIRYTCYKYMQTIKNMLKNDFIAYRTDCVYYVDTPENRKMVRDFFKNENMDVKQLSKMKGIENKKTLHG